MALESFMGPLKSKQIGRELSEKYQKADETRRYLGQRFSDEEIDLSNEVGTLNQFSVMDQENNEDLIHAYDTKREEAYSSKNLPKRASLLKLVGAKEDDEKLYKAQQRAQYLNELLEKFVKEEADVGKVREEIMKNIQKKLEKKLKDKPHISKKTRDLYIQVAYNSLASSEGRLQSYLGGMAQGARKEFEDMFPEEGRDNAIARYVSKNIEAYVEKGDPAKINDRKLEAAQELTRLAA